MRGWLKALLHPRPPGVSPDAPKVSPYAVALALALIAVQVVARYRWGFLPGKQWQGVHVLVGFATVFGVLTLFHGPGLVRRVRRETWFVLGGGLVFFLVFWYFGRMDAFAERWAPHVDHSGTFAPLYAFMYFSACAVFFRLFLPMLSARLLFGRRLGDMGLYAPHNAVKPAVKRVWIVYLLLFVGVMPFVYGVSLTEAFQHKYPLSRAMISAEGGIALEHFLVFELCYLFIFVSGESFWRGFLTFGTERDLGHYGLVLMVVPYVTAHFGKPLPETLGAIAAGMALGFLALKHRSVWLGVALHYAIALAMDLLAIRANGFVVYLE